jgi:outer membrane protein assembly factor BamB
MDEGGSTRRKFLTASGITGIVGLSGCLRFVTGDGDATETARPDDDSDAESVKDGGSADPTDEPAAETDAMTETPGATETPAETEQEIETETEAETTESRGTPGELAREWSVTNDSMVRKFVLEGDSILLATKNGEIRRIDATSGSELESTTVDGQPKTHCLARDDNYVVTAQTNERLKILDAESLSLELTIPFSGQPSGLYAENGFAYLGTREGLEKIELSSGDVTERLDEINKAPIWKSERGLFTVLRGKATIVSPDTLERIWQRGIGGEVQSFDSWTDNDHNWGLTELSSFLFVASPDNGLTMLDKDSGEELWHTGAGGSTNRAPGTDKRIIHQTDSTMVSRDPESGDEEWKMDFRPNAHGMVLHRDRLLVFGHWEGEDTDMVASLDPESRQIYWEKELDGQVGMLQTQGNRLFGLDLNSNELINYTH